MDALDSGKPELIAVLGRRRVGKTYLIRTVYSAELCSELTGMHDVPLGMQLKHFAQALSKRVSYPLSVPSSWVDAFVMLERYLVDQLAEGFVVICGSAASRMIVNVLHHKGGLHNRVTRTMPLNPFNLHETESFLHGRGVHLEKDQA